MEQEEHKIWEIDEKFKDDRDHIIKISSETKHGMKEIHEELEKVKKSMSRLESRDSEKCLSSRLVEHKL